MSMSRDNPLAVKATGFLAAGVHSTQITKSEVEKHRYDEMDDKLATIGTAFLGLTVGCARCHDHKYDPIPQRDYYRMLATFTTTVRSEVEVEAVARRNMQRQRRRSMPPINRWWKRRSGMCGNNCPPVWRIGRRTPAKRNRPPISPPC